MRVRIQPKLKLLALILAAGGLTGACADGQNPDSQSAKRMDEAKPASPELARLEILVGVWSIKESHFDGDGKVIVSVDGTERILWILDNHAIRRDYTSGTEPDAYDAMGILTWNAVERRYEGVWFDNVAKTGPIQVKAEWQDETMTMTYALESQDEDGSPVHHRVVERFIGEEQREATTYLIDGTQATKLLEMKYRRAVSCPGGARVIIDELHGRPE